MGRLPADALMSLLSSEVRKTLRPRFPGFFYVFFMFFFREDEPILGSRNHEHPKTSFKIHLTLITLNPRFLPSNSKQHCLGVPHLTQSGNQQYPARELHGAIPQKISKMDKAWIATNLMISYRSRIVRMIAFDSRSNQLKVAREFQGTAIST